MSKTLSSFMLIRYHLRKALVPFPSYIHSSRPSGYRGVRLTSRLLLRLSPPPQRPSTDSFIGTPSLWYLMASPVPSVPYHSSTVAVYGPPRQRFMTLADRFFSSVASMCATTCNARDVLERTVAALQAQTPWYFALSLPCFVTNCQSRCF